MTITGTRHGSAVVTLPSDREIGITRVFDAPAELVFHAWTTPELVRQWWGWESSTLVVCDIDLRVGGGWRYVTREADGTEHGWHGTYLEIDRPWRLGSTEVYEGYPDGEARNTLTLTERDGATVMEVTVLHSSRENRDGHLRSGMEAGMQHSLDQVVDHVASDPALARRRAIPRLLRDLVRPCAEPLGHPAVAIGDLAHPAPPAPARPAGACRARSRSSKRSRECCIPDSIPELR